MRTASQKRPRGRPAIYGPRERFRTTLPVSLLHRLDAARGDRTRTACTIEALTLWLTHKAQESPTALAPREQLPDRIGR